MIFHGLPLYVIVGVVEIGYIDIFCRIVIMHSSNARIPRLYTYIVSICLSLVLTWSLFNLVGTHMSTNMVTHVHS